MKSVFKCIAALLCLSLLTGCSSANIYSNYRETEQLMVVQSMGFDLTDKGYRVSVSTGGEEKIARMAAEADSITLAEQKMQDYSAAEELFYAHTGYIVIGGAAAREGISHYLDFIGRSTQMRLDTPLFVVTNTEASRLVLGSGSEDYDATDVLKSLERNLKKRGELRVFTAGEVTAQLDRCGAALVCAVKCVEASDSLYGEEVGLTALPDGYALIRDGKMIGQISNRDALAVGLLQTKSGPVRLSVNGAALQLDDFDLALTPIFDGGLFRAVRIELLLHTALLEGCDDAPETLSAELERDIKLRLCNVLNLSKLTGCDFLGLGGILEKSYPVSMAGMGAALGKSLTDLDFIINVSAELDRSFDADGEESA